MKLNETTKTSSHSPLTKPHPPLVNREGITLQTHLTSYILLLTTPAPVLPASSLPLGCLFLASSLPLPCFYLAPYFYTVNKKLH